MGTRSVYRDHVLDNKGEPVAGASVYLYAQHTTTPITATIYANDSDHPTAPAATLTNPLTTATDGSYKFYLADPTRIDVKITKSGLQDVTKTIDVTKVANEGAPGAISQLQDEGTNLTVRGTVNFTGTGVTASDDAANARTNVAISGGDLTNYARKDTAQTFTEDQTIETDNSLLLGATGSVMGGGTGVYWNRNAKWSGTAWVRTTADNDAQQALLDGAGDLVFYTNTDAGTTVGSIITWGEKFRISKAGAAKLLGAQTVQRDSAVNEIFEGFVNPDTIARFVLFASGKMEWGAANTARDTNLYRSAADALKTDDSFVVGGPFLRAEGGEIRVGAPTRILKAVTGTPEGVISADPGSVCMSDNGNVYRKSAGTGNTGWVAM